MAVPEELMAVLICLECGSGLADEGDALRCTRCGVAYPVEDGIPVMLAERIIRDGAP